MKMYYEKDTDVNLIKDKKIAIFGFFQFPGKILILMTRVSFFFA